MEESEVSLICFSCICECNSDILLLFLFELCCIFKGCLRIPPNRCSTQHYILLLYLQYCTYCHMCCPLPPAHTVLEKMHTTAHQEL
jgi:hypothetical protein